MDSESTQRATQDAGLTVGADTRNVGRLQRRHAHMLAVQQVQRDLIPTVRVSDHARNTKGQKRMVREATREARQHGGIDARMLDIQRTDERAAFCRKNFGRTLSSREWRNLSRAVSKNDERTIAKLSAAFRR